MTFNITDKYNEVIKYSNPYEVEKKADELFGSNFYMLDLSRRKNKKYRIRFNIDRLWTKWIDFGEIGYEDYTKHKDEERRNNFLSRNHKWKDEPYFTPAFLAYHLLW